MSGGNVQGLKVLLANTYALYLKTQNYHWNVTGSTFIMLHELFEAQYKALSEATDSIAERIRSLHAIAPGSFQEFLSLKTISEASANLHAQAMINDLVASHSDIAKSIALLLQQARKEEDEVTQDLLIERLEDHEKTAWMLRSHLES